MALEVTCVCGNRLKGKPQWAGRQAKCPFCGSVVTFPKQASDPFAPTGGVADLLDDELASSVTRPAVGPQASTQPQTTQPQPGQPAKKQGFFARLWRKMSLYGTIAFRWHEPTMYRPRLRGDIPIRIVVAMSVWAAVSGVMLVAVGVNKKPPHPLVAVFLGAVLGAGPAGLVLFRGRQQASGQITVAEREIHRSRQYSSAFFGRGWYEWSKWPYGAIRRCTIVPAEALGRSFSVAILNLGSKSEIVGIPKKINLKDFVAHMVAQGVPVEDGQTVPEAFTRPMRVPVAAAWAFFGVVCFLSGLSIYVNQVGGFVPHVANAADAKRDRLDQMPDKPPGGMPEGFAPPRIDGGRNAPGGGHGMLPGAADKADRAAEPRPPAGQDPSEPQPELPDDLPRWRPFPGTFPRGGMPAGQEPDGAMMPAMPSLPPSAIREPPPYRSPSAPAAPLQPGDTALAGGPGGTPFRAVDADRRPLVGFRYALGSWAGQPAIRTLDPLFDRSPSSAGGSSVVARDGYAVGGLNVRTGQFVTGVQVVFMAVSADGKLDPADSYTSDWIGEDSGGETTSLGGTGLKVIGVHGRRAAVLDAVGLVTEPQ